MSIDCGPGEFTGGPDVVVTVAAETIYETPLETALARAFTTDELAELAYGLADVPALIRGAGGTAVRPLAVPDGPLTRLLCALRAASGHAPAPATSRGLVPVAQPTRNADGAPAGTVLP